jgi:multidrug efflux pump subunit AcrA (membrane-fusion protein)
MHCWFRWGGGLALVALLTGSTLSQIATPVKAPEKPKADAHAGQAAKPTTHKVQKEPFKIELSLKGIFESEEMTEVVLRPEAWTPENRGLLLVHKAIEHGTPVHKGDVLVSLDLEKIDLALHELETERQMTDLSIKQAEDELPLLEKAAPIDLALAERTKKHADEDLKKFLDLDRPLLTRVVEFQVKNAANFLEYAREELRQLEKMYRSSDLREDTEEIILKRQRNDVEAQAFRLKMAEVRRDETVRIELPRQEQTLRENAEKQTILLDRTRSHTPLTLGQRRLALQKMKYDQERALDRLRKLRRDRELLTVRAPTEGLAYYGRCVRGQWTTASMIASKLQRGGILQPEEVFITIVKPRPLFVRATVDEKELQDLRARQACKVVPASNPDHKLTAKVVQVSSVPQAAGNFEARVILDAGQDEAALMPGMACTVKLAPYRKEAAVVVPATAVFAEELDEDQHFVYLPGKDGKATKHPVTIGRTAAGKTEILQGLHEGEEILPEKPVAK